MSRELSITELQAYLKQAIELETDVATQKEIISQYQKQSEEKNQFWRCNRSLQNQSV